MRNKIILPFFVLLLAIVICVCAGTVLALPAYSLTATSTNTTLTIQSGDSYLVNGERALYRNEVITITATPHTGHTLTTLTVNGTPFTSGETYTAKTDVEIIAISTIQTFDLTINATNSGVTLDNAGYYYFESQSNVVSYNDSVIIYAEGNTGYTLSTFTVTMGGVSQTTSITNGLGTCTIESVTSDIVVTTSSALQIFDLTMNKTNSSIAVNDNGMYYYFTTADCLTYGHSITIAAEGNTGYSLSTFIVRMGGFSQTASIANGLGTCTIESVTGDIVVTTSSTLNAYSLSVGENTNSTIVIRDSANNVVDLSTTQLTHGQTYTITATANNGYTLNNIRINGEIIANGASFVATENVVITTATILNTYPLSVGENTNSTIVIRDFANNVVDLSTTQLTHGQTYTITATANNGYTLNNIRINGVIIANGGSFVATANVLITTATTLNTYPLSVGENTNSTIVIRDSSNNVVDYTTTQFTYGQSCTITATANPGYIVSNAVVTMGGISQSVSIVDGIATCTISSVNGAIEISSITTTEDLSMLSFTTSINGINGYATVVGADNTATAIVIPSTISLDTEGNAIAGSDYTVNNLGNNAFKDYTNLTSVIIPSTFQSIGVSAFENCTNLTSIVLPNTITYLNSSAFKNCTSLTSINIPTNLRSVYDYALYNVPALMSITSSLNIIYSYAFYGCTGLTQVNLSSTITSLGSYAFYGCTGLTSLDLPNSITSIGSSAYNGGYTFANCTSLTSISLPNNLSVLYQGTFMGCSSITSIVIPNSVTSLGLDSPNCKNVFKDCTSLTSVTLSSNLTFIGDSAFENCTSLTSIIFPETLTKIGWNETMSSAFNGCTSLTSIVIPNLVTKICGYTFAGCTGLTSVTLPNTLTIIYDQSFRDCTALTTVNYTGTQEQWQAIAIGIYNTVPTTATINYNYVA